MSAYVHDQLWADAVMTCPGSCAHAFSASTYSYFNRGARFPEQRQGLLNGDGGHINAVDGFNNVVYLQRFCLTRRTHQMLTLTMRMSTTAL